MITRMQYAHPDRERVPAQAKPRGEGFVYIDPRTKLPKWKTYRVEARSKYTPHQSLREMERRCRQMYGEDK